MRIFVSYSHDSEAHRQRVLELAARLRGDGLDAWIDRYVTAPREGWPRWTAQQIKLADFVLLVCTRTYRERFDGEAPTGTGKGATLEGLIVTQILYEANSRNDKIIALVLDGESESSVPEILRPFAFFRYPTQYEDLYGLLTGQPEVAPPPVGVLRTRHRGAPQRLGPFDLLEERAAHSGSRILVVEDDGDWREILQLTLKQLGDGTLVETAESYPAALGLLSTRSYDVAVVDLALRGSPARPEEADDLGMQLLAEVRGGPLNRDCAVMILTGYPSSERFVRALGEYTAFTFLLKVDFEPQAFLATVRSALLSSRLALATRLDQHSRLEIAFDETLILGLTLRGPSEQSLRASGPPPGPDWSEVVAKALRLEAGRSGDRDGWRKEMLAVGSALFAGLGNGSILGGLSASGSARLELRFIGPASGLRIPFELLRRSQSQQLLGLHHIISRQIASAAQAVSLPTSFAQLADRLHRNKDPLRVLVVDATQRESERIEASLAEGLDQIALPYKMMVHFGDVAGGSLAGAVADTRPHLMHLGSAGESVHTELVEMGKIAKTGVPSWGGADLHLVFLSSEASRSGRVIENLEALANLGVPTVLGPRWPIAPQVGDTAVRTFYRALWQTFSPRHALLAARLACRHDELGIEELSWASFILLIRA